jgi:hypothetical protein
MTIEYICEREYPNDIEKQTIKKIIIENRSILREGDGLILPCKKGAIFFAMHGEKIEIIDFVFSKSAEAKVIEIKE